MVHCTPPEGLPNFLLAFRRDPSPPSHHLLSLTVVFGRAAPDVKRERQEMLEAKLAGEVLAAPPTKPSNRFASIQSLRSTL